MRFAVVMMVVMASVGVLEGKVYEKCELAKKLHYEHGMSRDEVKHWVCIAQHESSFNTRAVNHFNTDQSKDYGLFQVNSRYWCDDGSGGANGCGISCSALLEGNLAVNLECVKKIRWETERLRGPGKGWTAWVAYVNNCQNLDGYLDECWDNPQQAKWHASAHSYF